MSFIPISISTIEKELEKPSLTYRLDLDRGRIVGKVDGLLAVEQAIRKAFITPRFKCLIYDNQYGSEIKKRILSSSVNQEYIQTVVPNLINDCLKPDTRVLKAYDFDISFEREKVHISFNVDTIYGNIIVSEVI